MLYLERNSQKFGDRTAILSNGNAYTYHELLQGARSVAAHLLDGAMDLDQARVAFMVHPGFDYVRVQWGIWLAGGIAVPVALAHPWESIQYILQDTQASHFICSEGFVYQLQDKVDSIPLWSLESLEPRGLAQAPALDSSRGAMILYTSGTTALPKGVLSTHHGIESQIKSLVEAWEYRSEDHGLCVLPLHHIHGIINVISCTLYVGATLEFLPSFSALALFEKFMEGRVNVFMAVPTIYFKLIAHLETCPVAERAELKACMQAFRLMVCGSAALPVSIMEQWEALSGQRLLERYGMTEIGMAISNPYHGERRAGYVGQALPGVQVRLVNEEGQVILEEQEAGEIQIKGDHVFQCYWGKSEATEAAFSADRWFKTGDVALLDQGYYKILGRNSTDIIKSGGYKLSALEIEEVLRSHALVDDCSVIGLEDLEWGEVVAAVVIPKDQHLSAEELNTYMRSKMPAYRVPRKYHFVQDLPRNAMGKVTKNDLKAFFKEKA